MSQLKVNAISDAAGANGNAITLASDGTCTTKATNNLSSRRLNINGAIQINQRGNSTGVASDGYFGPDRYKWQRSGATVNISQDTDVPAGQGFSHSLKIDVTVADDQTATAGALHQTHYYFEGYDVQRLKYGSSNAKTLKLTFWIKSPKTGTHWVRLYSDDSSRMNNKKYTISSANTWEKKTLTFAGDTSNGFTADNSKSLRMTWWWSAGSNYTGGSDSDGDEWAAWTAANAAVGQVNCMDNAANNIYLTGIQLEETTATEFEHLPYGVELARCQRYFYQILDGTRDGTGNPGMPFTWWSSSDCRALVTFPTTMRISASNMSVRQYNSGSSDWKFVGTGSSSPVALDCDAIEGNQNFALLAFYSVSPTGTAGQAGWVTADDAANKIGISAELT